MESERPGQRRGVPILAPVMEHLKQLSRYTHAELMAAVVSGMFTAAITSERPTRCPVRSSAEQQVAAAQPTSSYQLGNGAILGLLPGEKLEAVNPGRPNAGFEPFVRAICQQIGAGLGLPTSSWSSSSRELLGVARALLEAWKRSSSAAPTRSRGFASRPTSSGSRRRSRAATSTRRASSPTRSCARPGAAPSGTARRRASSTRSKEVEAAELRVAAGFSTRTRETAELTGGNFERFNNKCASARSASAARSQVADARRSDGAGCRLRADQEEEAAA
jgi:hypothetical protein